MFGKAHCDKRAESDVLYVNNAGTPKGELKCAPLIRHSVLSITQVKLPTNHLRPIVLDQKHLRAADNKLLAKVLVLSVKRCPRHNYDARLPGVYQTVEHATVRRMNV